MRTIKVELSAPLVAVSLFGRAPTITISTEAIVADDSDADDAGREARQVVDNFIAGYASEDV